MSARDRAAGDAPAADDAFADDDLDILPDVLPGDTPPAAAAQRDGIEIELDPDLSDLGPHAAGDDLFAAPGTDLSADPDGGAADPDGETPPGSPRRG